MQNGFSRSREEQLMFLEDINRQVVRISDLSVESSGKI